MEQRTIFTLVIFATVVASGCADGGESTSSTSPLSVNTFEPVQNPVPADTSLNINMELENTGENDAENVAARLFGPTFATSPGDDKSWRTGDGGAADRPGSRTKDFGTLRASSDSNPSIPKQRSWSLLAPNLQQNREVNYNFYSQVFYNYETSGETSFKLVPSDRFRKESMSRSSANLDNTAGPIQLEIRGSTPKVYYDEDVGESAGQVESEMCIRAVNEGSGTAFLDGRVGGERIYDLSSATEDTIRLSIQNRGNVRFEARNADEGRVNEDIEVELVGGNEGFQCFDMIATGLTGDNPEQEVIPQVTAEYNYVEEDQTSVTVEGRR